jgi:thiazole biosynthesis protein ThiH
MEVLHSGTATQSGFEEIFNRHSWDNVKQDIYAKTAMDVERALTSSRKTLDDFKALISPAAAPFLEHMAQMSRVLTQKRFGKTIQLYAPLYLSNECNNICTYCGFSFDNKIKRRTLSDDEILKEGLAVKQLGFDHVLLVTGEAHQTVHVDYFKNALKILRPLFSNINRSIRTNTQNWFNTECTPCSFTRKRTTAIDTGFIIPKERSRISIIGSRLPIALVVLGCTRSGSAFYWDWKIGG